MSLSLRKWGLIRVRKVPSQISPCCPHRLIRDETFRFDGTFRLKKVSSTQNPVTAENVVPDEHLWTAQSNLGRHFKHMLQAWFSKSAAQYLTCSLVISALSYNNILLGKYCRIKKKYMALSKTKLHFHTQLIFLRVRTGSPQVS